MKRIFALILSLVMVLALFAGCGGSSDDSQNEDAAKATQDAQKQEHMDSARAESSVDDVIVEHEQPIQVTVALSLLPATFSPILKTGPYTNASTAGVYERLAEREQYGSDNFVGVLLKNWEEYNDGLSYHCELYDYITDSDGNKLTAKDVEYSIKIQAEDGDKPLAKKVEKFEITGDYTFDITLTETYDGLWVEFCEGLWIVTQAAYEKSIAEQSECAGTGPYKCVEFISSSYAIVEKRDDYWQTPELTAITSRANVDRIRYNSVPEVTQMAISIESPDDTQLCGFIAESLVDDAIAFSQDNPLNVTSIESSLSKMITFNATENSLCSDVNLRKAICYALNKEACIQTSYSGVGFAPKAFGVSSLMDYDTAWEEEGYYDYNVEKVKEYLKLAGYNPDNAGITLTWMSNKNALNESNAFWVAGCLAPFGITLDIQMTEPAAMPTYRNDPSSGWDIFEVGTTPSNIFNYLFHAGFGDQGNYAGHAVWGEKDDELQALVEKVKTGDKAAYEEYRNYVIDNALLYQYACGYYTVTHVDTITNVVTDYRNALVVGACTFAEDYPYVIE